MNYTKRNKKTNNLLLRATRRPEGSPTAPREERMASADSDSPRHATGKGRRATYRDEGKLNGRLVRRATRRREGMCTAYRGTTQLREIF